MKLTTAQALSWRLRQQGLDPVGIPTAVGVAERMLAIRGWPADLAESTVAVRHTEPRLGSLTQALDAGELIRSYAFRGGSYVFTHEIASVLLAVRTATRIWESSRWQRQGDFALDDWQPFRDAMRQLLEDGPKTRAEIVAHLETESTLWHLTAGAAGTGADSLYKPLHWWGDICFGPDRDGQATFRLLAGDPRWPGPPDVDEAGQRAVDLYLSVYGPATLENLSYWLTEGLGAPRRRLLAWIAALDKAITKVSVDGVDAYARTANLEELAAAKPAESVRLVPGFDPWVLGPGTADPSVVPPKHRALVSRGSHLVIWRGVVAGTWRRNGPDLNVSWFNEAEQPPAFALNEEIERLARNYGA